MSNSATHGLYSPWHPSGQNTGVGSRSLLWGIFPTQGSNSGLPHCRWILYQLSHQGSPEKRFAQRYSLHLLDTGVCVWGGGGVLRSTCGLPLDCGSSLLQPSFTQWLSVSTSCQGEGRPAFSPGARRPLEMTCSLWPRASTVGEHSQ